MQIRAKPVLFLLDILFPARCLFCRKRLPYDAQTFFCPACSHRIAGFRPREIPIPAGSCSYLLPYAANVRRAILAYKFHNKPQYAEALGPLLVPLIQASGQVDCLTWAPVSTLRLLRRGYDQSRLLAEAAGRMLDIPVRPLLRKHRHTRKQSRTPRNLRGENVHGAYSLAGNAMPEGLRIALIDDIVTTGSTLSECARVLTEAGARAVYCMALAH